MTVSPTATLDNGLLLLEAREMAATDSVFLHTFIGTAFWPSLLHHPAELVVFELPFIFFTDSAGLHLSHRAAPVTLATFEHARVHDLVTRAANFPRHFPRAVRLPVFHLPEIRVPLHAVQRHRACAGQTGPIFLRAIGIDCCEGARARGRTRAHVPHATSKGCVVFSAVARRDRRQLAQDPAPQWEDGPARLGYSSYKLRLNFILNF